VDVSAWEVVNPEPLGRKAKIWLREPGAPPHSRERDWLFKPVVVPFRISYSSIFVPFRAQRPST